MGYIYSSEEGPSKREEHCFYIIHLFYLLQIYQPCPAETCSIKNIYIYIGIIISTMYVFLIRTRDRRVRLLSPRPPRYRPWIFMARCMDHPALSSLVDLLASKCAYSRHRRFPRDALSSFFRSINTLSIEQETRVVSSEKKKTTPGFELRPIAVDFRGLTTTL